MQKKQKELLFLFFVFIGFLIMILRSNNLKMPVFSQRNLNKRHLSEALMNDYQISDCFLIKDFSPTYIEWQFADYHRLNNNDIVAKFFKKNNPDQIYSVEFSAIKIQENFFTGVAIPQQLNLKNEEICFTLGSPTATAQNTVSVYMNSDNNLPIYRVYTSFRESLTKQFWQSISNIIVNNY